MSQHLNMLFGGNQSINVSSAGGGRGADAVSENRRPDSRSQSGRGFEDIIQQSRVSAERPPANKLAIQAKSETKSQAIASTSAASPASKATDAASSSSFLEKVEQSRQLLAEAQSGETLPSAQEVFALVDDILSSGDDELKAELFALFGLDVNQGERLDAAALQQLVASSPGLLAGLQQLAGRLANVTSLAQDGAAALGKEISLLKDATGHKSQLVSAENATLTGEDGLAQADTTLAGTEQLAVEGEELLAARKTAAFFEREFGDATGLKNPLQANTASQSLSSESALGGIDARLSGQGQRQDLATLSLSLRQGHERPSMAELNARFAPVMQSSLIAMVRDGIQQAEIRLDPPELGSMLVRIQVQGSETQVQFQVMGQQTKDMVEQALPRLRELLAAQGLELTEGQVSHQERDSGGRGDDEAQSTSVAVDEIAAEEPSSKTNQSTSYASGIDYYA